MALYAAGSACFKLILFCMVLCFVSAKLLSDLSKNLNLLQEKKSLFLCPQLAQEFWSETKVGSEHILRNPLNKFRKTATEMMKALFAGLSKNISHPHNRCRVRFLQNDPEITLHFRDFRKEFFLHIFFKNCYFRIFSCLYIELRWLLRIKAHVICHPPIVNSKLNNLLCAGFGDIIHPHTSF